jgi:hypothetical protein
MPDSFVTDGTRGGRAIPRLHGCACGRDGAFSLPSFKRRHRQTHRPAIRASFRPHRPLHPHRVRPGADVGDGGHVRLAHPVPWPPRSLRANSGLQAGSASFGLKKSGGSRSCPANRGSPSSRASVPAWVPEAPPRRKSSLSNWRTGMHSTRAEQGERLTQGLGSERLGHRLRKWATSGSRAAARARG